MAALAKKAARVPKGAEGPAKRDRLRLEEAHARARSASHFANVPPDTYGSEYDLFVHKRMAANPDKQARATPISVSEDKYYADKDCSFFRTPSGQAVCKTIGNVPKDYVTPKECVKTERMSHGKLRVACTLSDEARKDNADRANAVFDMSKVCRWVPPKPGKRGYCYAATKNSRDDTGDQFCEVRESSKFGDGRKVCVISKEGRAEYVRVKPQKRKSSVRQYKANNKDTEDSVYCVSNPVSKTNPEAVACHWMRKYVDVQGSDGRMRKKVVKKDEKCKADEETGTCRRVVPGGCVLRQKRAKEGGPIAGGELLQSCTWDPTRKGNSVGCYDLGHGNVHRCRAVANIRSDIDHTMQKLREWRTEERVRQERLKLKQEQNPECISHLIRTKKPDKNGSRVRVACRMTTDYTDEQLASSNVLRLCKPKTDKDGKKHCARTSRHLSAVNSGNIPLFALYNKAARPKYPGALTTFYEPRYSKEVASKTNSQRRRHSIKGAREYANKVDQARKANREVPSYHREDIGDKEYSAVSTEY